MSYSLPQHFCRTGYSVFHALTVNLERIRCRPTPGLLGRNSTSGGNVQFDRYTGVTDDWSQMIVVFRPLLIGVLVLIPLL